MRCAPPGTVAGGELRLAPGVTAGAGKQLIYHPALFAQTAIHYTGSRYKVNATREFGLAAELEDGPVPLDWDQSTDIALDPADLQADPLPDAQFADLPAAALKSASYKKWEKELKLWLRHNKPLTLYRSEEMKMVSRPDETEADFRFRLTQAMREERDLAAEKLRQKYDNRFTTLKDRMMRAEQKVDQEEEQVKSRNVDTIVSFGTAILGAFMGRKVISSTSASRVGTAMKSAGRMQKEKMDVVRAQERVQAVQQQLADLEASFQEDLDKLEATYDAAGAPLTEVTLNPKSTGTAISFFGLVWLPYRQSAEGRLTPDWQ